MILLKIIHLIKNRILKANNEIKPASETALENHFLRLQWIFRINTST